MASPARYQWIKADVRNDNFFGNRSVVAINGSHTQVRSVVDRAIIVGPSGTRCNSDYPCPSGSNWIVNQTL